jgi:hypothetical protein
LLWIGWAVFVSVLLVMAVQMTCHVPRMDDWGIVIAPYFQWQDGGGIWKFLQTAGNDSRHHSAQLVHAATIKWWHWDPVVESLMCVALGGVSAAMVVDWWVRLGVKSVRVLLAGLVSVFLVLSPMQWMNWSWGIQLCYMLPIAGTMAVFWVLSRDWVLWKRVLVAVVPCWVAVFAFANGWLAVLLGGGMVLWEVRRDGWRKGGKVALGIWGVSAILAAWVYALDWPESRGITEEGLFSRLTGAPGEVVWFYLQLLGAPLADVFVTGDRTARVAVQGWVSVSVAVVSVGVLGACGVHLWRRRRELSGGEVVPWVVLILWGLGNAAAVTLARWGAEGFGPFQARYPGFTVWYFVGLLGLLAMTRGAGWKWVMRGMVVVMGVGAGLGGLQGWRDGLKAARNGHFMEAAVAMRHVAPEPVFLESTRPWDAGNTVKLLDRLDEEGLLHVKTVRSEKVKESVGEVGSWATGQLSEVEVVGGGLKVSGWAFDGESRGPLRAVAISYQAVDGEEKWLGIAGRNTVQRKKAEKAGARVLEDRIGWVYEPLTGEERAFISGTRLKLKRREVPTGRLTIRAYGYDPVGGRFAPLEGSLEVELPVK